MGLRCSLLGHDFGEPEVEREREERGNEVIETVREVKICERCGSESVVSENTEVRSLQTEPTETERTEPDPEPESAGVESAVQRVSGGSAESASVGSEFEDVTAEEDDGLILEDGTEEAEVPPEREPGQWPDAGDTRQDEREGASVASGAEGDAAAAVDTEAESGVESDSEAEETGDEDAEFIDADAESETADESDETSVSEHQPWPDAAGEDEGFDAKPSSSGGVELSGDLSADEEYADDEDVEYVEAGIESAGSLDPERTGGADGNALVCPQCGHETPANGSSLRAGDICPECRKGYLTEQ